MTRPRTGKRHIRWSRLANHDLDSDYSYLRERSPSAARRFAAEIFDAVSALAGNPEMGPVARDLAPLGRYRHMATSHHRIIYRIDDGDILILRVWDTRRNPDELIPEV